jgi:phage tail sheath protein FI
MPVTVSYPGVYVQEIPSGSRTIGGVATSITAFVGRTYRGPVNHARTIFNFGDFQRYFGGLSHGYPLGFAVRDFFQNGGSQAIIVRVYGPEWLTFPVASDQNTNATNAAQSVLTAVSNAQTTAGTTPLTAAQVAEAAEAAAAQYLDGDFPEKGAAANWLVTRASDWQTALSNAGTVTQFGSTVTGVLAQITSGAAAVVNAMAAATANAPKGQTADPTALLDAAQAAAAAQLPGPAQQGAAQVVASVQTAYATAAATPPTLQTAAEDASAAVAAAATALQGASTTAVAAAGATPESLLNSLAQTTIAAPNPDIPGLNEGVAQAAINALIARVMPTPGYALSTFPLTAPVGIATQMVEDGVQTGAAAAAALPATTASVVLQAPQSFVTVAGAAHSVAQAAWLASTENPATPPSVINAAQEAAAAVKTANPGSTAAINAARAVANATRSQAGAAAVATVAAAAASAVAPAVQAALNLPATNGAITALAAAEAVANAAWATPASAETNATTAAGTAGTDAVSALAAQAVAALVTSSDQTGLVAMSSGLVNTVAGTLPSLTLYAASPGEWANGSLSVSLDTNNITASAVASMGLVPAAGAPPFQPGDFFNLTINYVAPDGSQMNERWTGVSLRADAASSRLDRVLGNSSNLLAYPAPGAPGYLPPPAMLPVGGASGVAGISAIVPAPPGLQGTASLPLQLEDYLGSQAQHTGLYALDHTDQFDILCIPPDQMIDTTPPAIPETDSTTDTWRMELYQTAAQYCQQKRALLIIDPPTSWATAVQAGNTQNISITDLGTYATEGEYAAVYFPYLVEGNPLLNGQLGYFAPSGAIAGVMARTDASRGVWKAPAGITDGALSGTMGLELRLSDTDNGLLNPQGINCLRTFPVYGNVVWGARTLKGADVLNDDYKYVPVRRLAMYIEDSLLRGMQWAVFEPNAEPLWAAIRLSVGSFMNMLYRQGAFAGTTAKDAYYVACDATTTTQDEINQGIVNVLIGFAPLKPAEFVVITIQQMAGQTPA